MLLYKNIHRPIKSLSLWIVFLVSSLATQPSFAQTQGTKSNTSYPSATTGVATSIRIGGRFSCLLTDLGAVKCWGSNLYGQLGNGGNTAVSLPVDVESLSTGVVAIATGDFHTCAILENSKVKCWGSNNYGQLGDGTTQDRNTPVDVMGLNGGAKAIVAGYRHTCVITDGNLVKCWGGNISGQIGDRTNNNRSIPVTVVGLTEKATAIAAGDYHTCALVSTGSVWCWGGNDAGALGDNTTISRNVPVRVQGIAEKTKAIAAGGSHSCLITTGNVMKCWGYNELGQLGDNTMANRLIPTNVLGLDESVIAMDLGAFHTCVVSNSKGVKCWGWNLWGEIGDGTTEQRNVPINVNNLSSGVTSVVAGNGHTCALRGTGEILCWGMNIVGQLGDSTMINRSEPVGVVGLATTLDPEEDEDGDWLLNGWELNGIDSDGNGVIDLKLNESPFNADPRKPDLYLELDYMTCSAGGCLPTQNDNMRPLDSAIDDMVKSFARRGISLHVFIDEPIPMMWRTVFSFGTTGRGPNAYDDFHDIKEGSNAQGNSGTSCGFQATDGHFGSLADRNSPNCPAILEARRWVVRYGVFGYQNQAKPSSSGIAYTDDLLVTLGGWDLFQGNDYRSNKFGGKRVAQASALMHELGHSLGLGHGGGDDIGCKPNYLSIMNYLFQFPVFDPNRIMDYSDKALPLLNESALNEASGVSGPSNRLVLYGSGFTGKGVGVRADQPVDWNGNGQIDSNLVEADINHVNGIDDCKMDSKSQMLSGYDDWGNIRFIMAGNPRAIIVPNTLKSVRMDYGVTYESVIEMAKMVDADEDGLSNYDDNCPGIYNPNQEDSNRDGLGDICVIEFLFLPISTR